MLTVNICFEILFRPIKCQCCLYIIACPQVFDEMVIDLDWSQNAGMWMWLSCSSFFQQFLHTYCPVNFGKRIDPNGDFIRYVSMALFPSNRNKKGLFHVKGCTEREGKFKNQECLKCFLGNVLSGRQCPSFM